MSVLITGIERCDFDKTYRSRALLKVSYHKQALYQVSVRLPVQVRWVRQVRVARMRDRNQHSQVKSICVPSRRPPVARAIATSPRVAGSKALGNRSFVRSCALTPACKQSTVPDQVRHDSVICTNMMYVVVIGTVGSTANKHWGTIEAPSEAWEARSAGVPRIWVWGGAP